MYSAFFIRPQVEKESRVVRCDPFVQKYTVAIFVLRVHRRKDHVGGVLVGDSEALKACWNAIELQDGKFPDDQNQVMSSIAAIAKANKCACVFQQEGDMPTFSEKTAIETQIEACIDGLNSVTDTLVTGGAVLHVNPNDHFEVEPVGLHNVQFSISRYAVAAQQRDLDDKLRNLLVAQYADKCPADYPSRMMKLAQVDLDFIKIQVVPAVGTHGRVRITASFEANRVSAEQLVQDATNKQLAISMFRHIATADNAFLPKNTARGTLNRLGVGTTDVVLFDLSMDHVSSKLLPVLSTLFDTDYGVRGVVVAYDFEDGIKDKLFLLKGSSLTSEKAALDRCGEVIQEMYQEEPENIEPPAGKPGEKKQPQPAEAPKPMKKPKMTYFRFRV